MTKKKRPFKFGNKIFSQIFYFIPQRKKENFLLLNRNSCWSSFFFRQPKMHCEWMKHWYEPLFCGLLWLSMLHCWGVLIKGVSFLRLDGACQLCLSPSNVEVQHSYQFKMVLIDLINVKSGVLILPRQFTTVYTSKA